MGRHNHDGDRYRRDLEAIADEIRRRDLDVWLAGLLLPEEARMRAMAVWGLVLEALDVPWRTSEPTVGLMRLQWWRERLAGPAMADAPPLERLLRHTLPLNGRTSNILGECLESAALLLAEPMNEAGVRAWAGRWWNLPGLLTAGKGEPPPAAFATPLAEAWAITQILRRSSVPRRGGLPILTHDADKKALAREGLAALARARACWRPSRAQLPALWPMAMAELWLRPLAGKSNAGEDEGHASIEPPSQVRRQLWLMRRLLGGRL